MSIKIAVLGLGNMGRHHVRHLSSIEGADLVAVCDPNKEKADQFAQDHNCKAYYDLDSLLHSESLDAIDITAPTSLHFKLAQQCLNANVSVLVEKPICETVEDADTLIALAEEKSLTLMIGHIERFNPAVVAAKQLIDDGKLGKVSMVIARRAGRFPAQMKDANVVIDLAVHDIDVLTYLIGEAPQDVVGKAGKVLVNERPDMASILLSYPNGAQGFVHVNWITPTPFRTLHITGEKGHIELNYATKETWFYPSKFTRQTHDDGNTTIAFEDQDPIQVDVEPTDQLKSELEHFVTAVTHKQQPVTDGKAGKDALSAALSALSQF
jgi:predicted dehydrogenase